MKVFFKSGLMVVLGVALGLVLWSGSFSESFAQAKDSATLKSLILKKYDANFDGELTGLEKDGATGFLRIVDRNGDSSISDSERIEAIEALRKMPDPKMAAKPEKKAATITSFMKGGRSLAKGPSPQKAIIREGVIPDIKIMARPTAESIGKKREKLEAIQKMKDARRRALHKPEKVAAKAVPAKKKNYYDGTTIIAVSGIHTVVPQGAVLHVPPDLLGMIVKEPVGKLMRWPDFRDKHTKWVKTRKVSWETAIGEDPIKESERNAFAEGGKLIVAVFGKNPITVLEPPPEEKEEAGVKGALGSDTKKKRGK